MSTATAAAAPAPNELRAEIRRQLSALPPNRAASVGFLTKQINRTTPMICDEGAVQAALDWNHDRGWVDYRYNGELEWDEWFLTPRGQQKEGTR
jgi:hypothetical protein